MSLDQVMRMSITRKGQKPPNTGIPRSEDAKRRMRKPHGGNSGHMKGKKMSPNARIALDKVLASRQRPIQQFKNEEFIAEYSSLAEASKKNNFTKTSIWACLKGINKTHYGYAWKYKNLQA